MREGQNLPPPPYPGTGLKNNEGTFLLAFNIILNKALYNLNEGRLGFGRKLGPTNYFDKTHPCAT